LTFTDITRLEGHGNIVLDVEAGEIKELKLEITGVAAVLRGLPARPQVV